MATRERDRNDGRGLAQAVAKIVPSAVIISILTVAAVGVVQAQTYNVIYTFSGCSDGYQPTNTLAIDRSGSLYGTTEYGGMACGDQGQGVAFRLKRAGSGWLNTPIHTFTGGSHDGALPVIYGGFTEGPDGNFYGTAVTGGAFNQGVVFRLRPPASACVTAICPWSAEVLHNFAGRPDGAEPYSNVAFDSAGNMYGTTFAGGSAFGVAYGVSSSGGGWTENVLYDVGSLIFAGLTVDPAGNLYGANFEGGEGLGTVYELTRSGSGWTRTVLYAFTGRDDGSNPVGGLILDAAGNLYGTTIGTGAGGGGTVFELSPSGGGWTFTTLHGFSGSAGPTSPLTPDAVGNLYGTTTGDGAFGAGSVFKLTPSGNGWIFADLHDFQSGNGGTTPIGGVTLDASGNLYGTASAGGAQDAGVVWEIAP